MTRTLPYPKWKILDKIVFIILLEISDIIDITRNNIVISCYYLVGRVHAVRSVIYNISKHPYLRLKSNQSYFELGIHYFHFRMRFNIFVNIIVYPFCKFIVTLFNIFNWIYWYKTRSFSDFHSYFRHSISKIFWSS